MNRNWLDKRVSEIYGGHGRIRDFVARMRELGLDFEQHTVGYWLKHGAIPKTLLGDPEQLGIVSKALDMKMIDVLRNSGFMLDKEDLPREVAPFLQIAIHAKKHGRLDELKKYVAVIHLLYY